MGYKTNKKWNTKNKNSFSHEDKQNGCMEDRTKIQEVG